MEPGSRRKPEGGGRGRLLPEWSFLQRPHPAQQDGLAAALQGLKAAQEE